MFVLGMWDGGDVVLIFKFGVDLKGLFFFGNNFYFWGMDYFWSLEEFVKDLHVLEGPPLNMLLHVWFRLTSLTSFWVMS